MFDCHCLYLYCSLCLTIKFILNMSNQETVIVQSTAVHVRVCMYVCVLCAICNSPHSPLPKIISAAD